jgi:short-subunit dehydrogenase
MKTISEKIFGWNDPQVAIITGASSGLGAEYAKKLAEMGFSIIMVARRKEKLAELADLLITKFNVKIETVSADLSTENGISQIVNLINNTTNLDILINNAGFGLSGPFLESNLKRDLEMMDLHMKATTLLTRAALEIMRPKDRGVIINVSSLASYLSIPGSALYNATKVFVRIFTESVAKEFENSKIVLQALCPGFTHTGFHSTDDLSAFDKSKIPNFLWSTSEEVIKYSLKKIKSKQPVVMPGRINRLTRSLLNWPIIGRIIRSSVNKRSA